MGHKARFLMGTMDKEKNWLNYFYYAAPLWFVVEQFFWPNLRAGVLTGGSLWGNLAFYAVEGGLGAALYFRLAYARPAALLENAVQLIFFLKYILLAPLDMALAIDGDADAVSSAGSAYAAALPGALYSCVHIILRIKSEIRRFH